MSDPESAEKSVADMVSELIATGTMTEDTIADLNGYLAAEQAGTLEADDRAYLRALHARITGAPMPEPEDDAAGGLTAGEWQARAEAAEAEVERLRALLAERDETVRETPAG